MRITNIPALLFSTALVMGCNKQGKTPSTDGAASKAESQAALDTAFAAHPSKSLPDPFLQGLGKVVSGYLPVQRALAQDSFAKAKDAFMVMHGLLHTLPLEGLDSATLKAWNDSSEAMMEILHPMASSEDIADFRQGFSGFSDRLAGLIDAFGERGVDSLYQIHCPMAFGQTGANWLQQGKSIDNPYLGKAMPTCGAITRKIPRG